MSIASFEAHLHNARIICKLFDVASLVGSDLLLDLIFRVSVVVRVLIENTEATLIKRLFDKSDRNAPISISARRARCSADLLLDGVRVGADK